MSPMLRRLSSGKLPQFVRFGLLLAVYSSILLASLWLGYQLRFEFVLLPEATAQFAHGAAWLIPLSLLLLWRTGQFRSLLSYFSVPDAARMVGAEAAATIIAFAIWFVSHGRWAPPRSILLINLLGSVTGLVLFRLSSRLLRERYYQAPAEGAGRVRRVAVIGATDSGAHLVKEMKHRPGLRMQPVAFFDEDSKQWGSRIHGVPILGSYRQLFSPQNALNLTEVIIADPDFGQERLRATVHHLAQMGIKCEVAPSLGLSNGRPNEGPKFRPIELEDLLGRRPIDLQTDQIGDLIKGRCIAVSGAGGSIGSELCRQILGYRPRHLVLIEQCEVQLFTIEQELITLAGDSRLTPCVADILDENRIAEIFSRHQPEICFHAAAHKHVPLMEHQPAEAFQNNTIGTMRLAAAASAAHCARFVLISTDKAINPTSIMGATKRLAEIYLQALQNDGKTDTKFLAVRFGNVLGSSGSVIPTFKRQIAAGGPVTITHPEVTRYFMTTNEAVGLVLQSATQGRGGEIFVLDMGTPVKILDLARQLIELNGLRPDVDIKIEITGMRAGEKLFEELNHVTENHTPTEHAKIMRFTGQSAHLERFSNHLLDLHRRSHALSDSELKLEIKKLVPEYQPHLA